jgi:hypothetical protein
MIQQLMKETRLDRELVSVRHGAERHRGHE